jgi:hypothetical protein
MNTTTKTVEQLKEELRAAQEALQEVERKKQEEIREAKYAEQRAKEKAAEEARVATIKPWIAAVADALRAAGVSPVEQRAWGIKIGAESYPDPDLQIGVEREAARSSSYIRSKTYTGRYIMTVGDSYRDFPIARYPSKMDKGFNVAKIVATIQDRIEKKAAQTKREQEKERAAQSATALAAQVAKELGLKLEKYGSCPISGTQTHSRQRGGRDSGYEYWTSEAPKGCVYYSVGTLTVTPEQARVLHDALLEIKAMEPKKEQA